MNRLTIIITILSLTLSGYAANNCLLSNKTIETIGYPIKPFELIVLNADYSMAYAVKYVLTEKTLKIIFKGDLEGEKDSILFKSNLETNETLIKISNINIDSLKKYYSNPCIRDGSQVMVKITKGRKSKTVQLDNYYQPDIGLAIELINSLVPEKYKIWYDKATLIKDLERCKQKN
jgi:hypothetical protein